MLSSADATSAIAASIQAFDVEKVSLASAAGRILRQAVCAERDQPPFNRVMMDGIALDYTALEAGLRRFQIVATQHAGDPQGSLKDAADCIEVMTGAVLPQDCDCVIPVERLAIDNGFANVEDEYETKRYRFIHKQASDYGEGTEVLAPGREISPLDVAVIASCGLEQVLVSRLPTVHIISTGNELVAAGQPIDNHQIRLSNGPALVALLKQQGFEDCSHDHLADDVYVLTTRIRAILLEADILVLSGGVSMGKADYVPQVLAELGVSKVFHKISQRPGKPMWFGLSETNQAVFALPGNPVSSLVCARQYVLPALNKASGRAPRAPEVAELAETILFEAALTNFVPVRVHTRDDGVQLATPVSTNTSGDFSALSGTDGYIELERDTNEFPAGSIVPLHRWDKP